MNVMEIHKIYRYSILEGFDGNTLNVWTVLKRERAQVPE
jgi:hypothetical protein